MFKCYVNKKQGRSCSKEDFKTPNPDFGCLFVNMFTRFILCTKQFLKRQRELISYSLEKLPSHHLNPVVSGTYIHDPSEDESYVVLLYVILHTTLPSTAHHLINYSLPQECLWLNKN